MTDHFRPEDMGLGDGLGGALDARALHAAAREHGSTPDAFTAANDAIAAATRARLDATEARYELIREARAVGVPWGAISRWTGINVRTLHKIVHGEPNAR